MDSHLNDSEKDLTRKSLEDELQLIRKLISKKKSWCVGYAEIIISTDDIRVPQNTSSGRPGTWFDMEDLDAARAKLETFVFFLKELDINSCDLVVEKGYEAPAKNLLGEFELVCTNTKVEFSSSTMTELTEIVDPEHKNSKFVISKLVHVLHEVGELPDPDKVFGRRENPNCEDFYDQWMEAGPIIANSRNFDLKGRLTITVCNKDGFVDDISPTDEESMIDLQYRKRHIESSCLNIILKHDEGFVKRASSLVRAVEAALSLQKRNEWIKLMNISTKGLCVERLIQEQTCICNSLDDLEFRSRVAKRMKGRTDNKNVYVVGETGQGKSSTLRALCGSEVHIAQNIPTSTIDSYKSPCGSILFHDTPGLNDEQGRDTRIVAYLVSHVVDQMSASSILYVRKDWSRLPKSEQSALRKYWDVFGEKLADMVIIVVTSKRSKKVENDVRHQLLKMKQYLGSVPSSRIVYLGTDVDKAVLDREDFPESELRTLEQLLRDDKPRSTVNADVLEELLEDGSQFWGNRIIVQRQRDMLWDTVPLVSSFVQGTLNHSRDKWVGRRTFTGPVGLMNLGIEFFNIDAQFGDYNTTALQVNIEMAGDKSANAVRNSTNMGDVIEQVHGRGGVLVHLIVTSNVENRIRYLHRSYIAVCPGEKLTKELKDKILVTLYNEKAYAELVRAAQAECLKHNVGTHHI